MASYVAPPLEGSSRGLHRFACFTAGSTLFLIFAGGLVTSTGSGLAVPDWPLSFGQFFPSMTGGVFYEHGHRMIASFVGLLTVVLAVWTVLRETRKSVQLLGLLAALSVIFQGVLGGITVLYGLPPAVSIVHACTAQAFLCMVIAVAVLTGPGWAEERSVLMRVPLGIRRLAVATTAAIYGQLILGATMRHTGAGLAIDDFPLALGKLVPPLGDVYVRIHYMHRLGAVVVLLLVAAIVAAVLSSERCDAWLRRPASLLGGLVSLQVSLGALTIWSRKGPYITSGHVVVGAAVLATSLVLAMRADRVSADGPQ